MGLDQVGVPFIIYTTFEHRECWAFKDRFDLRFIALLIAYISIVFKFYVYVDLLWQNVRIRKSIKPIKFAVVVKVVHFGDVARTSIFLDAR